MTDIASEHRLEILRERYGITDTPHWKLKEAQSKIKIAEIPKYIQPLTYRPFDFRWIYYNTLIIEKGMIPNIRLSWHMLRPNVALLGARDPSHWRFFDAMFVSKYLVEMKTAESSRSCTVFPLYLTNEIESVQREFSSGSHRPNLNLKNLSSWAEKLALRCKAILVCPTA